MLHKEYDLRLGPLVGNFTIDIQFYTKLFTKFMEVKDLQNRWRPVAFQIFRPEMPYVTDSKLAGCVWYNVLHFYLCSLYVKYIKTKEFRCRLKMRVKFVTG